MWCGRAAAVARRARGMRVGSRPEGSAVRIASPSLRAADTRSRIALALGSATPQRAAQEQTQRLSEWRIW